MKNRIFGIAGALLMALSLAACGPSERELYDQQVAMQQAEAASAARAAAQSSRISFEALEASRATARNNASALAKAYMSENPRIPPNANIVSHGDTTITNSCPNGDGWATLSVMWHDKEVKDENGKPKLEKLAVKCSTVSSALGCYRDEDFVKKANLSQDEGRCQPTDKVPYPLPEIKCQ
jgi:hypothetical protein